MSAPSPPSPPDPGLCGRCLHVREIRSAKGGLFLLCGRAKDDPRFPRYPPLPVRACVGFERRDLPDDVTS